MTRTMQPTGLTERTVVDGIAELFGHGFWYFGIVVLLVSVVIPIGKLAGLAWLMLRVKYPRRRGLAFRTKLHRVIHEINRWSFADPFIVAVTAPLMAYQGIADVHAGPGALPFSRSATARRVQTAHGQATASQPNQNANNQNSRSRTTTAPGV